MDNNIDNLKKLIEQIKTIGFFSRLFKWRTVKEQLVDAASDLQKITSNNNNLTEQNSEIKTVNSGLTKDLELANASMIKQDSEISNYKSSSVSDSNKISTLTADLSARETTITGQSKRINELENSSALLAQRIEQLVADSKKHSQESATDKEALKKITERKNQLEIENEGLRKDAVNLQSERNSLKQKNTQLITEEEERKKKYENEAATLAFIQKQIQNERYTEVEDRNNLEIERLKNLKETWNKHEDNIKSLIKTICNKHVIEYVDKVPFKGDPDNTLKICDEFVVFDAKSPGSDDLTNFPNYLKDQAEKARKYARIDGVNKDIFFVVPTNTLEKLKHFVFNLGDFDVFIISADSLEQIILSLKKIEGYEFAEKLDPEERDNICRVLGKFAHLTKRRIQIDSFFAKQFLELAYKTEADLPKEFLDKVIEFEKSEKLNPPIERRAKAISIKELDEDASNLMTEITAKGLIIDELKISKGLNQLQLYPSDKSNYDSND